MRIRLVAVDMDGTFLRPDMTYDRERFLELRQRMRRNHVKFVVASGNQYWQLRSFFEPADEVAYAAENGHFLYDVDDQLPFRSEPSRPDAAGRMVEVLEDHRVTYLASGAEGALVPSWLSAEALEWVRLYFPRVRVVDDVADFAHEIVKATLRVADPRATLDKLNQELAGQFVPVVTGPEDVDLNVPGCNKAVGLRRLADRWGIDLANAVAFGDSYNDLEMLRTVGLPIAMANAPQDVQEVATRIAPSNTADGVFAVLEELLS